MDDQSGSAEKLILCQDCGVEFVFSAQEQKFFAGLGYPEPKRCRACRARRKAESKSKESLGGGGGGRGGKGWAGGRTGEEASTASLPRYRTVCSSCGAETHVPFKPDPNRNIYCQECYQSLRRNHRARSPSKDSSLGGGEVGEDGGGGEPAKGSSS